MRFVFIEHVAQSGVTFTRTYKVAVPGMLWFDDQETTIIGRRVATLLSEVLHKKLVFEKIEREGAP